ncbi:hypothetical protein JQK88_17405 [Mesorhizobium caraganae]|uniref:transcriptional repressor TraM n=1 Tax=Mesorhizobium caraganae TaxID=483206 RepID=UPI001783A6BC|nr:hypothetical protein [Mesorhizobium caraganae]
MIGLTENLPKRDLEQTAIQAIRRHRRLRDAAEASYEERRLSPSVTACDIMGTARIAYVMSCRVADWHNGSA